MTEVEREWKGEEMEVKEEKGWMEKRKVILVSDVGKLSVLLSEESAVEVLLSYQAKTLIAI